jgi:hypothetical protein
LFLAAVFFVFNAAAGPVRAGFGRYFPEKYEKERETLTVSLTTGRIMDLDGRVVETKRAGFEYEERREEYERYLENYTLDELGFDDSYPLLGLTFEKRWRWFTFVFDGAYFDIDVSSVAEREDFAVEVKEVEYGGNEYEHMLIPRGREFDTEVQGGIVAFNALFTPFHVTFDDTFHLSPWLHFGVYSFSGDFTIDAGPAEGLTHYEIVDYDYVIGGKGEGWLGAGFPEIGLGGEVILEVLPEYFLVFQANFVTVDWEGSTDDFGITVRHEKDIELEYENSEIKVFVEFPMKKRFEFLAGIKYQNMEADAVVEARDRSDEEQLELREKYDKNISFDLTTLSAFTSIRF